MFQSIKCNYSRQRTETLVSYTDSIYLIQYIYLHIFDAIYTYIYLMLGVYNRPNVSYLPIWSGSRYDFFSCWENLFTTSNQLLIYRTKKGKTTYWDSFFWRNIFLDKTCLHHHTGKTTTIRPAVSDQFSETAGSTIRYTAVWETSISPHHEGSPWTPPTS